MAHSTQFDFRLKVHILELELESQSTAITNDARASSSQSSSHFSSAASIAPKITRPVAADHLATDYAIHTIDTFEIGPNDIEYRAEGNANIVLALPQRCQVLRLPKQQRPQRDSSGRDQNICHSTAAATAVVAAADAAKVMECSQNERIFYVYKYIAGVSTLFGCRSNISTRPILVRIEFTNIDAFNEWLYNHRPIHRIQSPQAHKGHFIFDHGLLYHDACSLRFDTLESIVCSVGIGGDVGEDVLAVEIKPKQGWNICTLPESLLKLMEIGTDVRNRCRFCAMQHLKVKGHQVNEISKYCPLDLFSGVVARMKKSICNLIAAPQNNFRVFNNGRCVYADERNERVLESFLNSFFGHKSNNMDDFVMLLINILQYEFIGVPSQRCSIIKRVLDLQLLAKEAMPYVAQKCAGDEIGWNELKNDFSSNWPHSHIAGMCQKLNGITIDALDYDYLKSGCNLNDEEMYEIGATALDCSIMLTTQRVRSNTDLKPGYPMISLNGQDYIINATVFDLDPKLYPHHFTKYVKKTKESFNAYKQSLNS